jgi:hypothetical protein
MRARPRPISPEPSKVRVAGSGVGVGVGVGVEKTYCSLSVTVATPDVVEIPAMLLMSVLLIVSVSVAGIVPVPVKAASAAVAVVDADEDPEPLKLALAVPPALKARTGVAPESVFERENTTGLPKPFVWLSVSINMAVPEAPPELLTVTLRSKLSLIVSVTLVRVDPAMLNWANVKLADIGLLIGPTLLVMVIVPALAPAALTSNAAAVKVSCRGFMGLSSSQRIRRSCQR